MITEAVIRAVFTAASSFMASVLDQVLGAMGMPDTSIPIPSPFWFVIQYVMQLFLVVWPLTLGWWIWRQVKA